MVKNGLCMGGIGMKAIIIEKPQKLTIADREIPVITNPDELLIKVMYGGICGSDIGIYKGTNSFVTYPRVIGHEFGGEVVEVGAGVKEFKPGDKVAIDPVCSCGKCYACTHNRHNVCRNVEVIGVHRDGGFAEYVVIHKSLVYKIDTTKIPAMYMCLVEPYSIGMEVNYRADISKGDRVLVMGSGPIGLSVMEIAKLRGAQVIMTDLIDSRLERAKNMGADRTLNVLREDVKEAILDLTDGEGIPVVVDTVCSVDSFPLALDLASPAGRVVVLGTNNKPSQVVQGIITKKELNIVGSRLNNYHFREVIDCFEEGKLKPQMMVSDVFNFLQVEDAIKLIMEYPEKVCKVILDFTQV